jgi:hypothetical protein
MIKTEWKKWLLAICFGLIQTLLILLYILTHPK